MQFLGGAAILEGLAPIDEEDGDFQAELRFEIGTVVDKNAQEMRIEARELAANDRFHLSAELAIRASVESKLEHLSLVNRPLVFGKGCRYGQSGEFLL